MNLTSEAAWRPHVMHAWRHADIQRLQTPQEAGGHDTLPPRRPGQAPHTHTHTEGDARAVQCRTAEQLVFLCPFVRPCGRSKSSRNPQPDLWLEMGNKGKAAGWSGRPHGRTDAPAAPLRIQRPARPVRRVGSISSRGESQSLRHDHERRGRPVRRDGARGRPYVGEWGSRVGSAVRGPCEAGQQQSGVASALHCSARTELARQRGGSLARWWTGRAGGWGPVPAASAPALAPRLQRRGAVLFVLRLGKAATDGRAVGHPGHSAARARPGPDAVVARVKNNSGVYHLSSSSARPCAMSSFARNGS